MSFKPHHISFYDNSKLLRAISDRNGDRYKWAGCPVLSQNVSAAFRILNVALLQFLKHALALL